MSWLPLHARESQSVGQSVESPQNSSPQGEITHKQLIFCIFVFDNLVIFSFNCLCKVHHRKCTLMYMKLLLCHDNALAVKCF